MDTFIIGDVHGMIGPLKEMLKKFPKNSQVVFTGDFIDRGPFSAQVVSLIRKNGFLTVLGNHEETFIKFFDDFFIGMDYNELLSKWSLWLYSNGGIETLKSYGFWNEGYRKSNVVDKIYDDLCWMKQLPLYIVLELEHPSGKPVVVSHSNITSVWSQRNDQNSYERFKNVLLRTRDQNCYCKDIINVYGHTPHSEPIRNGNCINLDTGCCYLDRGFGKLCAYDIRQDRFIFVRCKEQITE